MSGVYGLGLGLTIAKHLMETMGGDITVESELGKGSKFTAILSLRAESETDEQQIEAEAALNACARGKKILIVEDNEINLEIETEILQDLGYETDFAPNGKIAVEKVQSSANDEYALVLMDIQMPVMDGRTAAKEIRKLSNAAHAKYSHNRTVGKRFRERQARIHRGRHERALNQTHRRARPVRSY